MDASLEFSAELFPWSAKESDNWVFVRLPTDEADAIKEMVTVKRGFGSVPVGVRCGTTEWRTSIFPDSKSGSYVLPIKKAVRKAETIDIGDTASFELTVRPD